ncbi:MAG TPA: tetratricopeptide repeat protein [Acidobacteriota bacterium]|nr:tetratricopeptide repeat protein [Acidobacteriota bacterium]
MSSCFRAFCRVIPAMLIMALLFPAFSQEPDGIAAGIADARALIDQGKQAQAIEKLRSLNSGNDPRVAQMMGVAFYHSNDPVHAIEQLTAVVDRFRPESQESRETIQILGLCHYLAGHIPESLPFLEQSRSWAGNNADLLYVLGMAYVQTRQPAKAREAFARMFGVEIESPAAHLLTAQMMTRLEFEEYAQAELLQALKEDARLPQAHFLLGEIDIFRARLDEGIAQMKQELELNPANSMALYRLGDAYTRQLKWDDAVAALQKSIWLNPYYSAPYILLGKAYMNRSQIPAAEGMLRHAIQFDPNNRSAHYMLAQVLQQQGRPEEAKREFDISERLHSDEK